MKRKVSSGKGKRKAVGGKMTGKGIFSKVFRGIKSVAKPAFNKVIKPLAERTVLPVVREAVNKVVNTAMAPVSGVTNVLKSALGGRRRRRVSAKKLCGGRKMVYRPSLYGGMARKSSNVGMRVRSSGVIQPMV